MTELTRGEINDLIAGFATSNEEYREALMKDPKAVLAQQMQQELPESLKVQVVQETPDTIYLVLPHVPGEGEELSDADLEAVAGGKGGGDTYKCNDIKGVGTRVEIKTSLGF